MNTRSNPDQRPPRESLAEARRDDPRDPARVDRPGAGRFAAAADRHAAAAGERRWAHRPLSPRVRRASAGLVGGGRSRIMVARRARHLTDPGRDAGSGESIR